MSETHRRWQSAIVIVGLLAIAGAVNAGEHPAEHPQEHPAEAKASALTKEELAEAISSYVEQDAALKGGFFLVYDTVARKPLALTLKKVHTDRLSLIGDQVYFACADFETPAGRVYDLDIFMRGPDREHLEVTEVAVHKEAGAERYTWLEKDGVWKKVPAASGAESR